jgi:hypothetical protein
MLHAALLAFEHPLSGVAVRAVSPLPDDFKRAVGAMRSGNAPRARKTGRPPGRR